MIIFAFDRDKTISTGRGPVPLGIVRGLVALGNPVYAIGNQLLCQEANIPGHELLLGAKPSNKEELKSFGAGVVSTVHPKHKHRIVLLEKVAALHPDLDQRIVVDDVDLSMADGWHWYSPEDFAAMWTDGRR